MMKLPRRRLERRKAFVAAALAAVLALGLAACYPNGPENLGELGIVLTLSNPEGNFQGLATYGMEDVVAELKKPDDDSSIPIDPRFNPVILEELQGQMAAAGFRREMDPQNNKPDVWLRVGAVESEVWVYWYSWGYYGGYPGYGWGGYYPPYVSGASFQQGTIIWELRDLRGIEDPTNPDTQPPVSWIGSINGALQGNAAATESGIRKGIAQGFNQSPYIAAQPAGN